MEEVQTVCDALSQARERGRGALAFVRAQTDTSLDAARAAFLATAGWKWHEIDARDCETGHELLTRAKGLTVDEDDVWLAWGLPPGAGPNGHPDWYSSMEQDVRIIEILGGPRIVVFVGVPQMQAFVRIAPELWKRKRAFVAWPEPEETGPTVRVDPSGAPRPGSEQVVQTLSDPEAVIAAFTQRLKTTEEVGARAELFHRLALVLGSQGRLEEARVSATKAARLFKDKNSVEGLAQCYELLSSLAERRGNIEVARDWIAFALECWQQVDNKTRASECHAKHGHLAYVLGDRELAAQQFQLALEIDEGLGNKAKVAAGLRRLGLMAEEEQKYKLAEKLFDDSHEICEELEDEVGMSRSFHHKGRLYERTQDYVKAFEMHRQSLELKEKLGDRLGIATSYHHLGNTYFFTREYDQAKQCYQQALAIEDDVGDNQGRAATLQQLGEVAMAEYRWGDALWYFMAAHALFRQLGSMAHTVALHIARAQEMLDEETVDQIRSDVRSKMAEYAVE